MEVATPTTTEGENGRGKERRGTRGVGREEGGEDGRDERRTEQVNKTKEKQKHFSFILFFPPKLYHVNTFYLKVGGFFSDWVCFDCILYLYWQEFKVMANVRETRKITVEEAPVPGATVPGETRTPNTRPLSMIVEAPSIIVEATPPKIEATSPGIVVPPKADTSPRENVGPALRLIVPILFYAVAVAIPTLCVYVPLTGKVILPVANGNGTFSNGTLAA